jgi:asparagine synthetase B (glutamine-hydrolysing)
MRRTTWHVEKPVDLTSPSLFLLYRGVKPRATVVMSGEGADELFAGYDFFLDRYSEQAPPGFPWAPYFDEVASLLDPAIERETGFRERVRATIADETAVLDVDDARDGLNRILYLFLKYYLVEMLERLDKTSMAWGVESRVPFLDHRLVEYVVTMPASYKAVPGTVKRLLKHVAEGLLPEDVVHRKKRPVPIPVDPKTVWSERRRANDLVQSGSGIGSYFDRKKVDDFLHKRAEYAAAEDLAIYRTSHALIALDAWQRTFEVAP